MQTVKQTVSKAKPNSEDHFLTKLSLNSQAEKKAILAAEKLFSHNLRKLAVTYTFYQNWLHRKTYRYPKPKTKTVRKFSRNNKTNLDRRKKAPAQKKIVVNQKDRPRLHPAGNYMF